MKQAAGLHVLKQAVGMLVSLLITLLIVIINLLRYVILKPSIFIMTAITKLVAAIATFLVYVDRKL